jgi:hypothetical protein
MEEIKKIKICKVCGLSDEVTNFQNNRRTCIKCNSKKCNNKLGNEYFRVYMKDHYVSTGIKRGRPKKTDITI